MKKILILSVAFLSLWLTGCEKPVARNRSLQTFRNRTVGYTLMLPKTWGAIQPYGETFTTKLYDGLETLGPNLPTAFDPGDRDKYYLDIEVFSDQNTQRNPDQSWADFYTDFRLKGADYYKQSPDDKMTEITLFSKSEPVCRLLKKNATEGYLVLESKCFDYKSKESFYRRSCRLIEKSDRLYSFCYNNNNEIHVGIINSLTFQPIKASSAKLEPKVPWTTEVTNALQSKASLEEVKNLDLTLPSDIHEKQIQKFLHLNHLLFALVLKSSMNIYIPDLPKDFSATFGGVLIAKDTDSQWSKFLEIVDLDSSASSKNNPYYLWLKDGKLALNVIDQNGAGSGEGIMKLFTSPDGGTWNLEGCYYYGDRVIGDGKSDHLSASAELGDLKKVPIENCKDKVMIQATPN